MSGLKTKFRNSSGLLIILFLCILFGYGFHLHDILLLEDDIAGRYKALMNKTAIADQLNHFKDWTMGRPLGHASNVTFQGAFLRLPEQVIVLFGILAIALQSVFLRSILRIAGFSDRNSTLLALVFFLTPIATPLFLPVHAFATELSTWFMLLSIYFLLKQKIELAGIFASLQFMTYETYATIFWLPIAFLIVQRILKNEEWDIVRDDILIVFKVSLKFFMFFILGTIVLAMVRYVGPGGGREAGMSELGLWGVISRMFEAGWIGMKTNLSLHFEAISWTMKNGPKYMLLMFIVMCGFIYFFVRATENHVEKTHKVYNLKAIVLLASLGLLLVFVSYLIFFEQRFPPRIKVGRPANIHSGARFGILLIAAAVLLSCERPKVPQFLRNMVIAVSITTGLVFQHAYGYQEAKSSRKKSSIIEALNLACKNSTPEDVIVILTPQSMDWYRTDVVIAWTSAYIAPTSFKSWKNKVAIVSHSKNDDFMKAYTDSGGQLTKSELIPFAHRSFSSFKWLYPWGDIARWPEFKGDIRVVKIDDFGKNVYVPRIFPKENIERRSVNTCIRR